MPPLSGEGFQHTQQSNQLKLLSQREVQKVVTENAVTTFFAYKRNVSQQSGGWKCKDLHFKCSHFKTILSTFFKIHKVWRYHLQLIFKPTLAVFSEERGTDICKWEFSHSATDCQQSFHFHFHGNWARKGCISYLCFNSYFYSPNHLTCKDGN